MNKTSLSHWDALPQERKDELLRQAMDAAAPLLDPSHPEYEAMHRRLSEIEKQTRISLLASIEARRITAEDLSVHVGPANGMDFEE